MYGEVLCGLGEREEKSPQPGPRTEPRAELDPELDPADGPVFLRRMYRETRCVPLQRELPYTASPGVSGRHLCPLPASARCPARALVLGAQHGAQHGTAPSPDSLSECLIKPLSTDVQPH